MKLFPGVYNGVGFFFFKNEESIIKKQSIANRRILHHQWCHQSIQRDCLLDRLLSCFLGILNSCFLEIVNSCFLDCCQSKEITLQYIAVIRVFFSFFYFELEYPQPHNLYYYYRIATERKADLQSHYL